MIKNTFLSMTVMLCAGMMFSPLDAMGKRIKEKIDAEDAAAEEARQEAARQEAARQAALVSLGRRNPAAAAAAPKPTTTAAQAAATVAEPLVLKTSNQKTGGILSSINQCEIEGWVIRVNSNAENLGPAGRKTSVFDAPKRAVGASQAGIPCKFAKDATVTYFPGKDYTYIVAKDGKTYKLLSNPFNIKTK